MRKPLPLGPEILYAIIATVGAIMLSLQIFYSNELLDSTAQPPRLVEQLFLLKSQYLRLTEYIYFILLYLVSMWIHYRRSLGNYYIFTTALFMTFVLVDSLVLAESFFDFRMEHGLWEGGFSVSGIYGLSLSLMAIIVCAGTYVVLQRVWADHLYRIRHKEYLEGND